MRRPYAPALHVFPAFSTKRATFQNTFLFCTQISSIQISLLDLLSIEVCNMSSQIFLQEPLASRSHLSLIVVASFLTSIVIVAIRSFAKRSDEAIPLYTPETVAIGNYKKRWSYDNPNALREAYGKVRYQQRFFSGFSKLLTVA